MGGVTALDKNFRSGLGQFGHRLVDRGQRRPDAGGDLEVVEADHRQVPGHGQAGVAGGVQHAGGHLIVAGEDGGGARRHGQRPTVAPAP